VVVLFDEFLSKFFKENADALPMHNAITRSNDRNFDACKVRCFLLYKR
jgi:hypothetical protein